MKLHQHPDFEQAILRAAEHFHPRGLRPAIIEKDYYVTEVLRIIAATASDKVIFKGGTSLSKGWNLIQRFSEDIDIFLDPAAFKPPLGKNAIDRELKKLREVIRQWPVLKFLEHDSRTIGGFGRSDQFEYPISSLDANHLFNTYALIKTQFSGCRQLFIATHSFDFYNLIREWAADDEGSGYAGKPQANWKYWALFYVKRTDDGNAVLEEIPRGAFEVQIRISLFILHALSFREYCI